MERKPIWKIDPVTISEWRSYPLFINVGSTIEPGDNRDKMVWSETTDTFRKN